MEVHNQTDRDLLRAIRRRDAEAFRAVVRRYDAFVFSSAVRRLGPAAAVDAAAATQSVFLVLARRAPTLPKTTRLAPWLFHVTQIACRRIHPGRRRSRAGRRLWLWRWPRPQPDPMPPAVDLVELWVRLSPDLDAAIDRLRPSRRDPVLLKLLGHTPESMAPVLRTKAHRASRCLERGLNAVADAIRRRGVNVLPDQLGELCARFGCAGAEENSDRSAAIGPMTLPGDERPGRPADGTPPHPPRPETSGAGAMPAGLEGGILAVTDGALGRWPKVELARRTLQTLAWARWRRRVAIGIPSCLLGLALLLTALWFWDARTGHSRLISFFFVWSVKREAKTVPGLVQPARDWPAAGQGPRLEATRIRNAADLYRITNFWLAHLVFTPDQWAALQPERIEPLPHFLQPDGTALLRNPQAQRGGLAGVLGYDFRWAHGDLEFGGHRFTNVAARLKGNGTYLGSLYGDKRAYKVDLNKFVRGQKLGGADELNFNNLVNDHSFMSDALGYEFFRDAGVPAPRTAYAYLSVSVTGQSPRKPLGLYAMVEPVDGDFTLEHLGSRRAPLFKPITYELFLDLGDDWAAYDDIYDLKTEATEPQRRKLIELARLVTGAAEIEFARRLEEFLDLDAFARFLACQVMLSNYDSLFSTGQNFYLYLDPTSNRFGFVPWDLDLAWGGFFLLGSVQEREQASIWHPWVGRHRFLERVLSVDTFRNRYRARLEELLAGLFEPRRLHQRIDELAALLREPVAAESDFRRRKFEEAVGNRAIDPPPGEVSQGANRPALQIKRFVTNRARSVRQQLDGKSEGVILQHRRR